MIRLFFVLMLASTSAFAGSFDEMLKEISKAISEDIDRPRGSDPAQEQTAPPAPRSDPTPPAEDYERTIVKELDCISRLGWQPSMQSRQECGQKHFSKCSDWLGSLPINAAGEDKFNTFFRYDSRGKCDPAEIGDRSKYIALLDAKKAQFEQHRKNTQRSDCMSRLEAIPIADGSSTLIDNLSPNCPDKDAGFEDYKAKREAKLKQIAPIEAEARAQQYAGLIHKHAKAVRVPANLLVSGVAVQWGGALGFPLIQFIDSVQTNSRSKATYEMNGKSLIMRHRITDPVKRKSVDVVYVFVPDSNEAVLSRLVWDGTEIPMKDIPQMFLQIAVGMKNG